MSVIGCEGQGPPSLNDGGGTTHTAFVNSTRRRADPSGPVITLIGWRALSRPPPGTHPYATARRRLPRNEEKTGLSRTERNQERNIRERKWNGDPTTRPVSL